jgi:hypothetical protein
MGCVPNGAIGAINNPEVSEQHVNFSYDEVMAKYSSKTMILNYNAVYRTVTKYILMK